MQISQVRPPLRANIPPPSNAQRAFSHAPVFRSKLPNKAPCPILTTFFCRKGGIPQTWSETRVTVSCSVLSEGAPSAQRLYLQVEKWLYLQVEKKARNLWWQVEEMSLTGFWSLE